MNAVSSLVQSAQIVGLTLDEVRRWIDGPHLVPVGDEDRREVVGALDDLSARARAWQAEPALLTVVLLGGTGVGKSTLLNALAGTSVAAASLQRPTTQFPTVYHHRDVLIDRLDERLQKCRTVAHDRAELRFKVLVDTPDIDSSMPENHERLREVLPLADAVLYVGSQEKYHDREGWELLMEHRGQRGFAFVLNKWDRCLGGVGDRGGRPPDEDFRRSLAQAGFERPLLFRTAAGQWARRRLRNEEPDDPVEDDFARLEEWLEEGLHEQAIRAIKLHGVASRLEQLIESLGKLIPADWHERTNSLRKEWDQALREAADEQTKALLTCADQHSRLFDAHFRQLDRRDYGGLFGWYLTIVELLARIRWSLKPQFKVPSLETDVTAAGPLSEWAKRVLAETPALVRETRHEDLARRLLAVADRQGWPLAPLESLLPVERALPAQDEATLKALTTSVAALETDIRSPTGGQHAMRTAFQWSSYWLPWAVFVGVIVKWLFDALFRGGAWVTLTPVIVALTLTLLTLMALHFIVVRILPTEWKQLRARIGRDLESHLVAATAPPYLATLDRFEGQMQAERDALEQPLRVLRDLQRRLNAHRSPGDSASLFAQNGK